MQAVGEGSNQACWENGEDVVEDVCATQINDWDACMRLGAALSCTYAYTERDHPLTPGVGCKKQCKIAYCMCSLAHEIGESFEYVLMRGLQCNRVHVQFY
jgi:hypothetical protein